MKLRNKKVVTIIFFFLALLVASIGSLVNKTPQQQQSINTSEPPTPEEAVAGIETIDEKTQELSNETVTKGTPATILKVVDGDTIEVSLSGHEQKVRIIGINTPESVDPRRPVECFGKEAAAAAKQKLTGQVVQLEVDPTQDERDKYGRLLRIVWADNGETNFGAWMIKNGYAYEYTYDTPHTYQELYRQLQQEAETAGIGLWAANTCAGNTSQEKRKTKEIKTTKKHCSDFATQAEAQAYFDAAGGDSSPEVKGMDGNNDGQVCESLP